MLQQQARELSPAPYLHKAASVALAAALVMAPVAQADRTKLKPGWNLYSPQQDVELGKGAATEAEKQLHLLNDARVDRYIDALGKRLVTKAPGDAYPYQFKVVNDMSINAFALPGGYIYVHRGVIESADNEAMLAGVIGHEVGHVALRHGTNQASKAMLAQGLLALGGAAAGGGVGGALAQAGGSLFASGVLLKYGRDAERQADLIGTQILYDLSYDPRAMAQFFEKLEAESKGKQPPEILSSHPNPGNRMRAVMAEIDRLGPFPRNAQTDSAEFRSIKAYVHGLPVPKTGAATTGSTGSTGSTGGSTGSTGNSGTAAPSGPPPAPSTKLQSFQNPIVQLQHPANWQASSDGNNANFIPPNAVYPNGAIAYGTLLSVFKPQNSNATHAQANDQLVADLQRSNANMKVYRRTESLRIGRDRVNALNTLLVNDSPAGGREIDLLVTVLRPEGLVYFIFVVPEKDAGTYEGTFQNMLNSVRFVSSSR